MRERETQGEDEREGSTRDRMSRFRFCGRARPGRTLHRLDSTRPDRSAMPSATKANSPPWGREREGEARGRERERPGGEGGRERERERDQGERGQRERGQRERGATSNCITMDWIRIAHG